MPVKTVLISIKPKPRKKPLQKSFILKYSLKRKGNDWINKPLASSNLTLRLYFCFS